MQAVVFNLDQHLLNPATALPGLFVCTGVTTPVLPLCVECLPQSPFLMRGIGGEKLKRIKKKSKRVYPQPMISIESKRIKLSIESVAWR
jgi:hypothetical protein